MTIPSDVVGKSCDEAKAELQGMGLVPSCNDQPTDNPDDNGKVLSTNPPAGQQVSKNTPVAINVGKAQQPSQVQVPGIVGKKLGQVKQMLQQAGLQLGNVQNGGDDNAMVVSSNPPPGTQVNQGQAIDVVTIGGGPGNNGNGNDNGANFFGGLHG